MSAGVVLVTSANLQEAELLAKSVIENHMAACCNILSGIRSIYVWEGKTCDEAEILLIIKTKEENFLKLSEHIRKIHTYKTPEIIFLPVKIGEENYLKWLVSNC